ncbi:hypothetical protein ACFRKE_06350 [Kitasatospora indigofera]|uniref:hypothetical protein n=1 Tax=Kitasatospora indigofera TaxID=67307 RepID=UPI0036935055
MTPDALCEMLTEQTPACGPARDALLSGGTFGVWDGLMPADQLFHTFRTRLRIAHKRERETLGLTETVGILERMEDELLRIGWIDTTDRTWAFTLFLNATATTVMACTGVDATQNETTD